MKRLLIVLIVLAGIVTFPALAGVPAKTELTANGSFTNPSDGPSTWNFGGELLAPVGGHFLIGPSVQLYDDSDLTAAGLAAELNIGTNAGLFAGASADFLVKDPDEGDREAVTARAGIKFKVGASGLVKVYLQQTVYGRGKDDADVGGVLALGVRF